MAGIVPRALRFLFKQVERIRQEFAARPDRQQAISVRAAYLEIYNEQVLDLLNPGPNSLVIRWTAAKGFYVENLFIAECEVFEDCMAVLEEGKKDDRVSY